MVRSERLVLASHLLVAGGLSVGLLLQVVIVVVRPGPVRPHAAPGQAGPLVIYPSTLGTDHYSSLQWYISTVPI